QAAVGRLAEVEHPDRVRMLQPRAGSRLVVEPLDPGLVGRDLRVQDLDRDDAVDRGLARLVHHAHPTLADPRLDLIAPVDHLADERIAHGALSRTRGLADSWSTVKLTLPTTIPFSDRITSTSPPLSGVSLVPRNTTPFHVAATLSVARMPIVMMTLLPWIVLATILPTTGGTLMPSQFGLSG